MGRDYTKPLSAAELEELKHEFRTMPTYEKRDGQEWIASSDMSPLYIKMGCPCTPERLAAYTKYWDIHYNGFMSLEEHIKTFEHWYDSAKVAVVRAAPYDKNGDGFISLDEYEDYMKILRIHDPALQGANFEEFVKAADTNQDGKVSLQEFGEWIAKCLEN